MIPAGLPPILIYALTFAGKIKYPLVLVGAAIEGPILMIACGFLLHEKVFTLIPLFLALMFGDLIGDVAWYYIGYFFSDRTFKKHGKFVGITPEVYEKVKKLFEKYKNMIIFLSKITMGFGFAIGILVVAGATKMSMWKFLIFNFIGEFFFVALMHTIGYFFGHLYSGIQSTFKIFFLVTVGVVVLAAMYGFTRYMKTRAQAL